MTKPRFLAGAAALAIYAACIVLANWAIHRYGMVAVGFGLMAPAGAYFAGLSFVARDITQQAYGKWLVLVAILAGAGLSAAISPTLALASGVTFLCSELADFIVWTPLVQRGHIVAGLLLANTVGLVIDSLLFLQLAFHSTAGWDGLALAKAYMTIGALPFVWLARRRLAAWQRPWTKGQLAFAA